jgi:hypothetical protein
MGRRVGTMGERVGSGRRMGGGTGTVVAMGAVTGCNVAVAGGMLGLGLGAGGKTGRMGDGCGCEMGRGGGRIGRVGLGIGFLSS